jgi:single-stranded-DNA-specific exonuclease
MIKPEWIFKTIDEKSANNIAETFSLPNTIAKVMSLRGITSRATSREFFYPDQKKLHNPFEMKDMDKAVDRILDCIKGKKTILIFGDYDVDGTSSAAFLTLFFKSIGLDAHYYIPSREKEGYGISIQGIDYAKYIGADLFISCDCGINAFDKIKYSNDKGLDVIITDHHKPSDELPDAFAVVNPNRFDCTYPFKGLCGASVAFKLALAICSKGAFNFDLAWMHSDIVTLGIAADLVPIQDENRIIVHHGIQQMKKETNLGITALLKTGGLIDKTITVGRLIFWLAPKINAAGRLGDASRAVKLLTTRNPILAKEIAEELEVENNRRKDITLQITSDAIHLVNTTCDLENENAIVLGHESWHPGVIGIVASRIKENYARPAIIMSLDNNNEGKGSCRSISEFDMVDALDECSELLSGYGGHPIAAGLSLDSKNFSSFKKKFISIANKKISYDKLIPSLYIDCELNLDELNNRMINFLNAMEPYGPGNARPVFVSKKLSIDGIPKLLGKDQNTLKFNVKQNQTHFESIGFNMVEHYEKLIQNAPIDIAYVIGENVWNGKKTIQLEIKDIKLSQNYA